MEEDARVNGAGFSAATGEFFEVFVGDTGTGGGRFGAGRTGWNTGIVVYW